jgi:hypothetical protein
MHLGKNIEGIINQNVVNKLRQMGNSAEQIYKELGNPGSNIYRTYKQLVMAEM